MGSPRTPRGRTMTEPPSEIRRAGSLLGQVDAPPQGGATVQPRLFVDHEVRNFERDDLAVLLDPVLCAERAGRRVAHVTLDGIAAALGQLGGERRSAAIPVHHAI